MRAHSIPLIGPLSLVEEELISVLNQPSINVKATGLFPTWVEKYIRYGSYALIAGVFLFICAFFTNPIPDPSFPWATLPASLRIPFNQPRIEHWPVTYTLAIWLWVFFFPALFLRGYRDLSGPSKVDRRKWLILLPTLAMLAWTTYCRFFWPKLDPASWNAPAYTFICWLYCATYVPLWSNLAFAFVGLGATGNLLAMSRPATAKNLLTAFGILSLPLGLPVLVGASRMDPRNTHTKR